MVRIASPNHPRRARFVAVAICLALAILYLSFNAGGYFAGSPAALAVVAGVALALRITIAERPFAGFSGPLAVAAAALGLYAVWALVSVAWSDAPGRALVEFDRALLYWLVLVFFGSLPRGVAAVRWLVRGVAAALLLVCLAGLISRVAPDLWPVDLGYVHSRLSYPLTYWNAMGLASALAIVLCAHFAFSEREPVVARILGAGALPLVAATLVLTFSRGGFLVAVLGLVAYGLVARPRGIAAGLLSAGVPTAVAIVAALGAERLAGARPTSLAATAQGHELALVAGLCALAATALRLLLAPLDRRLSAIEVNRNTKRWAVGLASAALVLGLVAAALAVDLPGRASEQYDRFVRPGVVGVGQSGTLRGRLTDPGNNGRIEGWDVALNAFADQPLRGIGAGTYGPFFLRERKTSTLKVEEAHSLYLENLAELGLVGVALLAIALVAILGAFAFRARRKERHVYAALLAAGLAWAVHAGLDWDWEMPAITLWLFAVGGLALASAGREPRPAPPSRVARLFLGVAVLALVVTPGLMALSQAGLNSSVSGLKRGDCATAIDSALASTSALAVRPEPYLVLSLCDTRLDRRPLAVTMARNAIRLEPQSSDGYYTLAIAQANAGIDPRPAARRARQLNPLGFLARDVVRRFNTNDPQKWKRRARSARLPIG